MWTVLANAAANLRSAVPIDATELRLVYSGAASHSSISLFSGLGPI